MPLSRSDNSTRCIYTSRLPFEGSRRVHSFYSTCFFEASLSSTCDRVFTKQTIENEANRIEFEFLFPAILETKRDHFDQFSTAGEEKLKTVDVFAGGGEENRGD